LQGCLLQHLLSLLLALLLELGQLGLSGLVALALLLLLAGGALLSLAELALLLLAFPLLPQLAVAVLLLASGNLLLQLALRILAALLELVAAALVEIAPELFIEGNQAAEAVLELDALLVLLLCLLKRLGRDLFVDCAILLNLRGVVVT